MLGVAALISSSPTALTALKYFGAAYLLYLAYGAFGASGKLKIGRAEADQSVAALYQRGVLMNVLNPKVLLFFLAFLPQFIVTNGDVSTSLQIAMLGLTFAAQALIVFSLVSMCAARLRQVILKRKNLGAVFGKIEGWVLVIIAVGLFVN